MYKRQDEKGFILLKEEKVIGYGYFDLFNNINSEKKLNSRVVKVDECKKIKNYVYRVISEKRYKKLLTMEKIYKFSNIE